MTEHRKVNLYAVKASWAPLNEVHLILAADDAEAMDDGVYVAAHDACGSGYGSPSAQVWCAARDLEYVGEAFATDAPAEWEWAHPGVEENALEIACLEIECGET